ncbi:MULTISPECIES: lipid IV(A) 3-deoxy-D-manno-octulosonic acid transferase [unclassified Nitratiruptor]|uniref:lipid IV(A) 3-deoxy-D-manno-octulosonic acid transferase n=1 Tax=unclassified Nitratiruptor TaxID=2624044 RepID=UPI001937E5A2|nr:MULTISPECIES: lipid IV(A) 3-deoxy-D-manno-octulosonic acid transferase [unclassified Nitratiruptor]BCD60811.1 3-deoxy-D-manno-octulosonic-acid transferase [Nitratiruptor sp. YY08-10]BCD64743.1 3-deoxy-D-manno-octulosonic-acid transferase [Nitratiruptor sp. YY08-14]
MALFCAMFAYIYTFITIILYLLALPFLLFLQFKDKYHRSIPARFFLRSNPPFSKKAVHFHSCSYGETKALEPLVREFDKANISVITQTGFEAAKSYTNADVRYLPFEPLLWFWLKSMPALVVMEAELWYLLFYLSKKRDAVTFLINARISERSFPKYKRFAWFYKKIFENIDYVYAQSDEDAQRLRQLGAKHIEILGNIKLLQKPKVTKNFTKQKPVVVAASTHDPEEEIIATEWVMHLKDKTTLVVVPRHPERFEEVDELLEHIAKREGLAYHRFSENPTLTGDIVLVDTLGELVNIYAVSDLVILGGSFVQGIGGHNPLEPAFFHKPIISGPYFHNHIQSYSYVDGIKIVEPNDLGDALKQNWEPTAVNAKIDLKPLVERIKSVV